MAKRIKENKNEKLVEEKIISAVSKRRYCEDKKKAKFIKGTFLCLLFKEKYESISENEDFNRVYKVTFRLRKGFGIPGKALDKIDKNLMEKYSWIPLVLFRKTYKEEKIKKLETTINLIKKAKSAKEIEENLSNKAEEKAEENLSNKVEEKVEENNVDDESLENEDIIK